MSEQSHERVRPTDALGRILFDASKALAIFGGLLCFVMAVIVTVSVTGRYLFASPIPGDYDIVAILSGCAVFAFLPYCQITRGNVMVDFFTTGAKPRTKAVLDAIGTLLYLAVAVLFTWRLYYGMLELRQSGEMLANFNFYRWWTIPLNVFCMIILVLVIAYTFVRDIGHVKRGEAAA
jgi:TRAP-type C4-dicarboxylate transport system permease small subunit